MPLRDHFRPPLSESRHWEAFHAAWAGYIAERLNLGVLPPGYIAEEQVHHGARVEIDVATDGPDGAPGARAAAWSPRPRRSGRRPRPR